MKLKKHNYLLLIIVALAFTACKQKSGNAMSGISTEDSMKITFYDKYFGVSDSLVSKANSNRPVSPDSANLCIDYYGKIKLKKDTAEISKMLKTEYISFNFQDLTNWMKSNLDSTTTDEMKIFIGVNREDYLMTYDASNVVNKKDRLTVFLWPYNKKKPSVSNKSGEEIEPFNLGQLYP